LSITVVPAFANSGAHSKEVLPPAEKIAILGAILTACLRLIIVYILYSTAIQFYKSYSTFTPVPEDEDDKVEEAVFFFLLNDKFSID